MSDPTRSKSKILAKNKLKKGSQTFPGQLLEGSYAAVRDEWGCGVLQYLDVEGGMDGEGGRIQAISGKGAKGYAATDCIGERAMKASAA